MRGRTTSAAAVGNRHFHSRLYSVPSTNSLMSENAAEHRHIMTREQIWNPLRRNNGFEVTDHNSDDSPSEGPAQNYVDSLPHSETSRSEVFALPNRGEFGQGNRLGPSQSAASTTQGGREPGRIRRSENRPEAVPSYVSRPPSPFPDFAVSHTFENPLFATESVRPSSGSHRAQEGSPSSTDEWTPAHVGQRQPQQASTYSYTNLNLDSFQSGMFRDSLQRSADVHRPISRQLSWNAEEESDSSDDMDFGIARRRPVRGWNFVNFYVRC